MDSGYFKDVNADEEPSKSTVSGFSGSNVFNYANGQQLSVPSPSQSITTNKIKIFRSQSSFTS